VTSGGGSVTSGEERRARRLALAIFAAVGLAFAVVNALSEIDERTRLGRPVDAWEPWCWELTSLAGFLAVAPVVFAVTQRLRPPRLSWPAALAAHALLTVPFSLAHVGIMVALRHASYWALADAYRGAGSWFDVLVYEYRKDLITYAVLAMLPHVAARLVSGRPGGDSPPADHRIEVRDGSRIVRLAPGDVEWAQAAGNYVELHGTFGTLLHRQTLAALAGELEPHGFARIHRSRIVRSAAIAAVETRPSGDFDVTLASGAAVGGSRRYRSNL
jgi:DNA-binding LytR/AlgR family response regulator